jgi:hypothetical protein
MQFKSRGPLLALLVVALVAACSATAAGPGVATLDESQAPGGGPPASASPSLSPQDSLLAYARCMREHGIDMPDPEYETDEDGRTMIGITGGAPGTLDKDKFADADEACKSFLSAVMEGGGPVQMSPEDEEKLLQFARCMREQGIDFPDPGAGGMVFEIGPSGPKGGIDPSDPDFQAAQEVCGDLLPGRLGEEGPNVVGPGGGTVPGTKVNP